MRQQILQLCCKMTDRFSAPEDRGILGSHRVPELLLAALALALAQGIY